MKGRKEEEWGRLKRDKRKMSNIWKACFINRNVDICKAISYYPALIKKKILTGKQIQKSKFRLWLWREEGEYERHSKASLKCFSVD